MMRYALKPMDLIGPWDLQKLLTKLCFSLQRQEIQMVRKCCTLVNHFSDIKDNKTNRIKTWVIDIETWMQNEKTGWLSNNCSSRQS